MQRSTSKPKRIQLHAGKFAYFQGHLGDTGEVLTQGKVLIMHDHLNPALFGATYQA